MARKIAYAILNVVRHPHPDGAYKDLFDKAAAIDGVKIWGETIAGITRVVARDGIARGRLAFWTDIDPREPVIQKKNKETVSQAEAEVGLPRGVGFNPKLFNFAFNIKSHTLYVELRNDEDKKTSAGMVERAFKAIFSAIELPEGEDIYVQAKTSKEALKKVLNLKEIRRVEIDFNLPNPDDLSQDEEDILREMHALHARRLNVEIYREQGSASIELTPRYRTLAEMARDNGYVEASGKNADEKSETRTTKSHPAVVYRDFEGTGDDSSYGALISLASE